MEKQRTLASSASLTGSALHTGENVTLTILPAPTGHGFKFQRMDLPDEPIVDAVALHVKTVERATTLVQGMVKIHTVEHVLSALTGMGVDNALIQMDANEPPIGDGSASEYIALINKAGILEQDALAVTSKSANLSPSSPTDRYSLSFPTRNSGSPAPKSALKAVSPSFFRQKLPLRFTKKKSPPPALLSSTRMSNRSWTKASSRGEP